METQHRKTKPDLGPWMDLLGAVISQNRLDAIALRRCGVLDESGKLTSSGNRRFQRQPKCTSGKNRITGLQRRDEVETIGRMIYQGGMTELLTRLGLPDIGDQIKGDVERQAGMANSPKRAK